MRRLIGRSSLPPAASKNCSASGGIGVRLTPESVFGLPWNQCSAWSGIRTKIGELTMECDFLSGALGRADGPSAKR